MLIESLESEVDSDVEEAWRVETERRVAELDAGTAKTVPWEVVKADLVQAVEWYAERSSVASRAFVQELTRVISLAARSPETGQRLSETRDI